MSERSPTDETGSRKSKQERLAAKERAEKPLVNEGHEGDVDKEMQRFCSEAKESEKKRRETSGRVEREMEQFAREDSTKERTAGQGEKKTTITGVRETTGPDSVKRQAVPDLQHEGTAEFERPRPDTAEKLTDSSSERVTLPDRGERTGVHVPTSVPENPHRSEARKPIRLPEGVPTQDELDRGIERHVYLEDRDFHRVQLKEARAYIELKEAGPKSDVELRRFAESHDLPLKKVTEWDSDAKVPKLVELIRNHDYCRERYEQTLSSEAKERCIDPSAVYEAFRELRDVKEPSPEQIVECVQKLTGGLDENHRVVYCRLYPYAPGGPMWLNELGHRLGETREEVQAALNERLGLQSEASREVRVGISGHRLYLWLKDVSSDNWMNQYGDENFHMRDIGSKRKLIEESASGLGIGGSIQLSRLIAQVTDYPKATSDFNPNIDLKYTHPRLRGETLHFLMDTMNLSNADIEQHIDHVGRGKRGWGVIRGPLLTTDVEAVLIPIISIVKSDGHIDPNGHITYPDESPDRIHSVREAFCRLGDVDLSEIEHPISKVPYLHAPAVVGRLLMGTGMEPGDKAIQNEGLPDLVMNATPKNKAAYLKELISDDGGFSVENGIGEFQWNRSVVLDAGEKAERYGHRSLLTDRELALIRSDENRVSKSYGLKGEAREEYHLRIRPLKELTDSADPETARTASSLLHKVKANPPKLMEDERQLCADLGILTTRYPTVVIFFADSERVSVAWRAQTSGNDYALVWATEAMPNHAQKAKAVSDWLKSRRAGPTTGNTLGDDDGELVT